MLSKRFKTFNIGDDLHTCITGPFQILKKLDNNAYVIDLSESFGVRSTFNIEGIMDYKCPDFNPSNLLVDEPFYEPISERLSLPSLSNIYQYNTSSW